MTKILLNTLFVGTQGAYLRLENDQVRVELEGEKLLQVPLHHLGSITVFGLVTLSGPLLMRCADDGRTVVFLNEMGRFRARVVGKTSGNVYLRRDQYECHREPIIATEIARQMVAGKLQNARQVLLRGRRDSRESLREGITLAIEVHEKALADLATVPTIDEIRGHEGTAAQSYFSVFDDLITSQKTDFGFSGRSRRPPRDRINCLLSFLYSLGTTDCVAALEGVGLDPQFGFLHVARPGRPALALDLVEEFRAVILDRLALSLVNRKQLQADHFMPRDGGSVLLADEGRKILLTAYQTRKQQEVRHPLFKEKVPIGLLPHVQARLLARVIRGDAETYLPYQP